MNGNKLAELTITGLIKYNLVSLMDLELFNMFNKPYNENVNIIPIDRDYVMLDDTSSTLIWLIPADLLYVDMIRLIKETFSVANRNMKLGTKINQELTYDFDMLNISQSMLSFLNARGPHDMEILGSIIESLLSAKKSIERREIKYMKEL